MARYFTKRPQVKASLYVENEHFGRAQDHMPSVDDHVPTFTGLLDANGEEIWKEPRAIGFGRREDW